MDTWEDGRGHVGSARRVQQDLVKLARCGPETCGVGALHGAAPSMRRGASDYYGLKINQGRKFTRGFCTAIGRGKCGGPPCTGDPSKGDIDDNIGTFRLAKLDNM